MATPYTLNNINDLINAFAVGHKQLKGSYYFGRLPDNMSEQDIQYPCLLIDPQPSTVEDGIERFDFTAYVLDRIDLKRDNEIDALSDTKQIAKDLIAYFRQTVFDNCLTVETTVTMTPLIGAFDDLCNGWEFPLSFKQYNNYSMCSIPFEPAS